MRKRGAPRGKPAKSKNPPTYVPHKQVNSIEYSSSSSDAGDDIPSLGNFSMLVSTNFVDSE